MRVFETENFGTYSTPNQIFYTSRWNYIVENYIAKYDPKNAILPKKIFVTDI